MVTDDIVTRLREYSKGHSSILYDDTQEAADEIERLRTVINSMSRTLQLMNIDYRTQLAGIRMRCTCGAAIHD